MGYGVQLGLAATPSVLHEVAALRIIGPSRRGTFRPSLQMQGKCVSPPKLEVPNMIQVPMVITVDGRAQLAVKKCDAALLVILVLTGFVRAILTKNFDMPCNSCTGKKNNLAVGQFSRFDASGT